ncbi:MAG: putative toxin-antitoxin system toxin component, PIN family [Flavobacteriales bacterium]
MPLRAVADCNVLISLLIGGKLTALRDHLLSRQVRLFISERLLAEVLDVGVRSHLARYFDARQLRRFIELLREVGEVLPDEKEPSAISRDPDDDYLLALCLKAKAHVLITGDKDLLVLVEHGPTRIMKARAFMDEFLG